MKILIVTLTFFWSCTHAQNATEDAPTNKTKRTIAAQVQSYGENRPVLLYSESPPNLANFRPVYEPEAPKQAAAQQVLYEFQQTPTNAVSNVHVNQFYQPIPKEFAPGAETIATPVQHGAIIRHGPPFGQVHYNPFPQHLQTQQIIPGKLIYVNGKITYPQNPLARPLVTYLPQQASQKVLPPLIVRPAFRRFSPPAPQQFQPITKPMNAPQVTEEPIEEEKPVKKQEEEEEVEEEEEKESYEDDDDRYFSKYSFDDDEESFQEDEDDDNERGSSKSIVKKHKKTKKPKFGKYSQSYSSSHKYEKPSKKKIPKVKYRTRNEKIEGKQSQNVPVVHKQKIFKEKWFVTKSTDGSVV